MTGSEDIDEIFSHINKIKSEYKKMYQKDEDTDLFEEPKNMSDFDEETVMLLDEKPITENLEKQHQKTNDYEKKLSFYEAELNEKNQQIHEITKELQDKNSLIEEHVFEIERLRTHLFDKNNESVFSEKKLTDLEKKINQKDDELSLLKNQLQEKTDKLDFLKQELERVNDDFSRKEEKFERIRKRNERDRKRIQHKNKKIRELKQELEKIKNTSNETTQNEVKTSEDFIVDETDEFDVEENDDSSEKTFVEESEITDESEIVLSDETQVSSLKDPTEDSIGEQIEKVESVTMMTDEDDLMSLSERMNQFQQDLNSLDLPDLSSGVCDICGEEIMLEKNLSGLVVGGNVFACEKCCTDSSKEDLSDWTKSKMKKPGDVRPIGLWLTQEKNKQRSIRGNIKL
jgi:myosin heavy subunit